MQKLPKITLNKKPTFVKFAQDVDLYRLFQKIEQAFSNCFLFESLGSAGKYSRYSIVGFDPKQIIRGRPQSLIIDGIEYLVKNPYYTLKNLMPAQTFTHEYAGGLVGYLGYDAVNYFEPSLNVKTHPSFDQFLFGVYTDGLILDKVTNELLYFYYDVDRRELLQKVMGEKLQKMHVKVKNLKDNITKKTHAEIVARVKEQISRGNTFQCEVGFKSEFEVSGNALLLYGKMRQINPSPFMYYVKFENKKIIGASPELLFSLRNGEMVTRPLAGTTKRGRTPREDTRLARALLHDPKERAEHSMLVDMHRNDIGKVAKIGTVKIRDLMTIEKFSHVQHISSEVAGIIKPSEDMFSALASNFPMGTVCGAPKIETIKIIDSNEASGRGPYGGGVGHFGFNGDCTFALTLRSVFLNGNAGYTQTSSGIVSDSVASREYDEVQKKLEGVRKVLTA